MSGSKFRNRAISGGEAGAPMLGSADLRQLRKRDLQFFFLKFESTKQQSATDKG